MQEPRGLRRATVVALALALSVGFSSGSASAQPGAEEKARALFAAGVAAVEKGDFATGCPKLAESLTLVERAGTLLNLARCDEHDGHLVKARTEWARGVALLPPNDERLAISKARLAKLEPRIPKVTLQLGPGAPSDVQVTVDGVTIARARLQSPVLLDPGPHSVVVSTPGHAEQRSEITLVEGQASSVSLSTGAAAPGAAPIASNDETPPPGSLGDGPPTSSRRTIGFVVGGIGLVGAIAAGITSGMLASRNGQIQDACVNKICTASGRDLIDGGKPLMAVNAVAWGVGIAGLGLGTFLVVTSPSATGASVAFAPAAVQGGAGLGATGRF